MAVFEKEALIPNRNFLGCDDLGNRVEVSYTPQDIDHLNRRLKEMIRAGLQVPLAWEHQETAKPMSREDYGRYLAEKVKLTCGHITDGYVSPRGTFVLKMSVDDPEDLKTLRRIKFCSPEIIHDFVDGSGRKWPGLSITHLAATPRPVQHVQSPFQLVRMGLNHPKVVRLSLGGSDMADDDFDFGGESESDTSTATEEGGGEGGGDHKTAVFDLLKELYGVELSPAASDEELFQHLHTALLTAKAHGEKDAEDTPPGSSEYADDAAGGTMSEVPSNQVLMSLQNRLKSVEQAYLERERQDIAARYGRVQETLAKDKKLAGLSKALKDAYPKVRLSLGSDGKLQGNDFVTRLETVEALLPTLRETPPDRARRELNSSVRLGLPEGMQEVVASNEPDEKLDPHVMSKLSGGLWKPKKEG